MPLPGNVSTGVVTGQLTKTDGSPAAGQARFRPTPRQILDASANVVLTSLEQTVTLDALGQFSIVLVATDDLDLNPFGWTWDVFIELDDQPNISFAMLVPGGVTTDIADVMPVPSSEGTYYITGPAGPPGSGALAATQAQADAGSLTTVWMNPATFKGRLPYIDVANYGAVGNGVANDTAAIQAAITAAAALVGASTLDKQIIVKLGLGKHYMVSGGSLTIPKAVLLKMEGSKIQASSSGTILKLNGIRSGVHEGVIWGVGGATDNLGIHMSATSTGARQEAKDVVFDALGGRAILCEALASEIERNVAQGCLILASGLAVPTGVLEVNTTDCWITEGEYTASRSSLSSSGFAYACVLKGGTHTVDRTVAEISDHGWYITATETTLTGARADLNFGHGFVFAGGGGTVQGCKAMRNSRAATNTYDGFNWVNNTNWAVTGNKSDCLTAEPFHRYGFYDATNGYGNYNQFDSTNRSTLFGTAPIFVEPFAGSKVDAVQGPFVAAAAAATTINVQQYGWPSSNWTLSSVAPVNFTDFLNPVAGMRLTVFGDGQTTFVHNAAVLRLTGGVNLLAAANVPYEFVDRNGIWYQV